MSNQSLLKLRCGGEKYREGQRLTREKDRRTQIHWISSIHFRDGSQDERSKSKTQRVEGERERCDYVGNAKLPLKLRHAHDISRASNGDEGCQPRPCFTCRKM